MTEPEFHVASFVVRARPDEADSVRSCIEAMQGVEVHASDMGKLVVTAEASGVRGLADTLEQLSRLPSVLSVSPVYHEYADGSAATESI